MTGKTKMAMIDRFSQKTQKSCLLLLLMLMLATVSSLPSAYASPTLILDDSPRYPLQGHLDILIDPQGELTFKDVLSPATQNRFSPIPGFVNRSYTEDTIWVRTTVQRTARFPEDTFLRLWPPYLDYLDVYVQTGDAADDPASYQPYHLGDHLQTANRPIINTDFTIPLFLTKGKLYTIYLRVRTTSSLSLTGDIHTEPDYISFSSKKIALQGGYLATALVISLINLILFIRLRDRLYLYFSMYLFSLFLNSFPGSGIMTLVCPSLVHKLSDYLVGAGVGGSIFSISLFGMRLFANNNRPWTGRFLALIAFTGAATAFSVPFGIYNHMAPILFCFSLLLIFVLTWLSLKDVTQGVEGGGLYLAAFGATNIGYAAQLLRLLGVMPVAWWNMHAVEVSSLFNMVMMTLAMTERVRRSENLALQSALEAEQKAVQLAESMTEDLREKQQQLEEALEKKRESLKQKERFVAMINHEYRTPLAIIQANISLLEMKTVDADMKLLPVFNKIKKAMERLVEVLETSVSRESQSGIGAWRHQQSINLGLFLKGLLSEASTLWPDRRLNASIPDLRDKIFTGDMILLKTAVLNLLDNAFKYSPQDSKVSIEVQPGDQSVTIVITDHGCGIPKEQIDLVFEKGYRASNMTDDSGKGLGLYLAKSIIEQYGGSLTIASDLASGTCASIILPLTVKERNHE
ncbi:MAG: hypothetical protein FIA91_03795 [Geobacter sp.]|nr:hypothetical protein [Geobacter sp.]